jgi:signal transduction histidine kinase/CheY-like chemotaxis protein
LTESFVSTTHALGALVEWFLPPALRDASPDTLRRAKLCVAYNLAVPIWAPGFGILLWVLGQPLIGAIILGASLLTPLPLIVLRRTGSLVLTGNVIASVMSVVTVICTWLEGGLGAPGVLWFPLVPILAMLIAGRRTGIAWTAFNVLVLLGFYVLRRFGHGPMVGMTPDTMALLHMSLGASATIVGFILASLFESLKADALSHLETANRALALARDQAEAATRAKSDFLATMSHEIRTPIHGIFGMTELALDTTDDTERRDFLNRTRACADTLLAIINDILDFSRIEAGKLELVCSTFDPRGLVDGVLDTLTAHVNAKNLELLGQVGENVPARLLGDAGRLRQILINLAGNAVKFTDEGAVTVRLEAGEDARDGSFLLRGTVGDTGIGIPADQQAAIFEAFTQVAGWTTSTTGGTGLGLAITRRLVDLMGGDMHLDSGIGIGSRFTFTVRLGTAPATIEREALHLRGRRILVVDANPISRAHVADQLRGQGADAPAAGCAVEARAILEHVHAAPVDAVVLNPPASHGARDSLVAALRTVPGLAHVPCVALVTRLHVSGDPTFEEFAAVVPKPVKRATLVAALAKVLVRPAAVAS